MAEAAAAVTMILFFCALNALPLAYGLPFAALGLIPIVKVLVQHRRHGRFDANLQQCLGCFLTVLLSPLLIARALLMPLWHNPRRVLHPLGPGFHIIVALSAVPLLWFCNTNVPVVVLWTAHTSFCLLGLVEILAVRRFAWREDLLWLISAQTTALTAYLANTIIKFDYGIGSGSPHGTYFVILGVSTLWLLVVLGLALTVNRALIIRYFRAWQHRHGIFRLQAATGPGTVVAPLNGADEV
jgi:hypothetical protein